MKRRFGWYLPPTPEEEEQIWKSGTLTVDTNVLLDLYRYHTSTQQRLLDALKGFSGRAWLSQQVALEFIRNRTQVIAASSKTFKDAEDLVAQVERAVATAESQLKGKRLVPRELADTLAVSVRAAIDDARSRIASARAEVPNYFGHDPVLYQIAELFDEAVGPAPSPERHQELLAEGARRADEEVPPGYLDSQKDGERPFGDFFLWMDILEMAKERETPIILVTSERKSDWWEKISGRTVWPRRELMKEAWDHCQQRVIIYHTETFLHRHAEEGGRTLDTQVAEEIIEVGRERERGRAVEVFQVVDLASPTECRGTLEIVLKRPVKFLTGTGHFEPPMASSPWVWVELLSAPDGVPKTYISAKTGTDFDFNVHIRSVESDVDLPAGEYLLRYAADTGSAGEARSEEDSDDAPSNAGSPSIAVSVTVPSLGTGLYSTDKSSEE